jgi:hypothetical protein
MYWLLSQFDADNGVLVRDIIKKKALKQIQLPLSVEKEQGSCSQALNNSFEGIIVDLNVSLPASCCLSIMYYLLEAFRGYHFKDEGLNVRPIYRSRKAGSALSCRIIN